MVVAVLHARILRLLRSVCRISVFGDGVLERARSTSLALLGTIAAIGLAIVAFALQLGWPIGTDGPLPNAPQEGRQAVGSAVVAAVPSRPPAARRNRGRGASRGQPLKPAVGPAASHPGEGSNLVVSNSEPTAPPSHRHPQNHQDAPQGQPAPAPQAPQSPQTPQGSAGASKPQPSPPPEPAPVPHPTAARTAARTRSRKLRCARQRQRLRQRQRQRAADLAARGRQSARRGRRVPTRPFGRSARPRGRLRGPLAPGTTFRLDGWPTRCARCT